jgi:hypothetical protein
LVRFLLIPSLIKVYMRIFDRQQFTANWGQAFQTPSKPSLGIGHSRNHPPNQTKIAKDERNPTKPTT